MKVNKKVVESAVLATSILVMTVCTAIATPEDKTTGNHKMVAGFAAESTTAFAGQKGETATKERNEVEIVTAVDPIEAEWANKLMADVEESMNVRAEASEEAALAGKLRKGDVAEVVEKGAEWTKITSGNLTGYVKNELCVYGMEAYAYAQENCPVTAKVLEGGLRLRGEANEDGSILDVAAEGDVLTVATDAETPAGWVAVKYEGSVAYVSAQFVEVTMETGKGITVEEEQALIAKKQAEEEAARAAAEAKRAAAISQKAAVAASYDELTILAAVIQLEAGNECYEGQVAVGAVIMNRVRSGGYPNTIVDVVYQPGQFGVRDRIASRIANGVSGTAMQAAQQALSGYDNVGGATHFAPVSSGKGGLVIGNHAFY